MHIKSGELGQPGTGRQNEPGTARKLRLGGGATRVPVQTKPVDSPLRVLVSAIGQSLGSRTQMKSQATGSKTPSSARTSLFSTGAKGNAASSSTPVPAESKKVASSLSERYGNYSSSSPAPSVAERYTGKANPSRVPSTPSSSRMVPSTPPTSRVPSTPGPSRIPSTPASSSRIPSTPASSRITSTPAPSSRIRSTPAYSSRIPSTPSSYRVPSTPASTRIPSTPGSSRLKQQASAAVPATPAAARRSSLSSSTSSSSSISTGGVRNQSLSSAKTASRKNTAAVTPSTASRKANPSMTTPVSKSTFVSLRTPKTVSNNPTTPSSRVSSVPTPRRPAAFGGSTPGVRNQQQLAFAHNAGNMGALPITPISRPTYADPSTPVHGVQQGYSTPLNERDGSNTTFYTPNSTLPLTPLQPKNFNVPESSRKLQFDSNGEAMADQENLGTRTPKTYNGSSVPDATFTFDKNRLAQIKARRNNGSQLLKSPAQRVMRVHDLNQYHQLSHTPGRGVGVLQQVAEDRSARFDDDGSVFGLAKSPVKRRVANSLF